MATPAACEGTLYWQHLCSGELLQLITKRSQILGLAPDLIFDGLDFFEGFGGGCLAAAALVAVEDGLNLGRPFPKLASEAEGLFRRGPGLVSLRWSFPFPVLSLSVFFGVGLGQFNRAKFHSCTIVGCRPFLFFVFITIFWQWIQTTNVRLFFGPIAVESKPQTVIGSVLDRSWGRGLSQSRRWCLVNQEQEESGKHLTAQHPYL